MKTRQLVYLDSSSRNYEKVSIRVDYICNMYILYISMYKCLYIFKVQPRRSGGFRRLKMRFPTIREIILLMCIDERKKNLISGFILFFNKGKRVSHIATVWRSAGFWRMRCLIHSTLKSLGNMIFVKEHGVPTVILA